MKRGNASHLFALVVLLALALAVPAGAATKHHGRSSRPKISMKEARATALSKVPGGKVVKHELEKESGKLIYTFDIKVAGQSGVEEVHIDANTGEVLSQTHETAKKEHQEAKQEKSEPKQEKSEAPKDTTKTH